METTSIRFPIRNLPEHFDRSRITLCHHAVFRTSRFIKREKLVRHGLVHQQRLHLNK